MSSPITSYEQACAEHELNIPEHYNFGFDCIDVWADDPSRLAFIALDAKGEEVARHSFARLRDDSNRLANALLDLGAAPGDLAFVMIPRVPAWYQVMVGCCKAGIVAMPGTNLLMPKDIVYRINRAGARIAIVTAQAAERVDEIRDQCPTLELLVVVGGPRTGWHDYESCLSAASPQFDRARVPATRRDDLMLIYFTSGTTAMPKMVPRDHGYALAHAITGRYWMDLREGEVHWTLSDTGWAKAAWGLLFGPWQMGAVNVLIDAPGFDADLHLRLIDRLQVRTFCAPPTVYRMFAQLDLSPYELRGLRHSMSAGEPLNPEVIKVWQEATGGLIYDGYGQTETINIVGNFPFMAVRPGSMGRPVPGVTVDVVDDDGERVADDTIGHIAVRLTDPWPAGLFHGYWQDEEATAKVFRNGWYYTGDTATRDADGYFWFVGRSDDIISSAGYRISPFEVESTLLEHPAVVESAVVGVPDALRGQIVKAFVVLAAGHTASDALAAEIQEFVKTNTAPYKYPREIEFRDTLPKTISGKFQRVQLRQESA